MYQIGPCFKSLSQLLSSSQKLKEYFQKWRQEGLESLELKAKSTLVLRLSQNFPVYADILLRMTCFIVYKLPQVYLVCQSQGGLFGPKYIIEQYTPRLVICGKSFSDEVLANLKKCLTNTMRHKQNTVPKGLCDAFQNEIVWQKMCFYIAQILSEVYES